MDIRYRFERIIFDATGPYIQLSPEDTHNQWPIEVRPGELITFRFDLPQAHVRTEVVKVEADEDK